MTPFEICQKYLALKQHFTSDSYDYFRYNGKIKLTSEMFNKRKDKHFFEKISRHKDPVGLIVANYVQTGSFPYIADLDESKYLQWKKLLESFTYSVKQDLTELEEPFIINFKIKDHEHPPLLKLALGGKITIETFCILLEVTNTFDYFQKKLENDIIWKKFRVFYTKYMPFIRHHYDKKTIVELLKPYTQNMSAS